MCSICMHAEPEFIVGYVLTFTTNEIRRFSMFALKKREKFETKSGLAGPTVDLSFNRFGSMGQFMGLFRLLMPNPFLVFSFF